MAGLQALVRLVAGAVMVGLLVLASVGVGSTSAGCATADTNSAPDAGLPLCNRGPFLFCTEVPLDQPGCNSTDGTSPLLKEVPPARYGTGCTINYVGDRDPIGGDCRLDAVCKCLLGQRVPVPTDAGGEREGGEDGGDAGTPTASEPNSEASPIWQCYP